MERTLIVEDSFAFRSTFKAALCKRFPKMLVEEAESGPQALAKVAVFKPSLVFMDIRLPDGNGLDLTEKMKQGNPAIVVIILTDYDLPEYRDAATQGGADEFITKGSLNMSTIEEVVTRHRGDKPQS